VKSQTTKKNLLSEDRTLEQALRITQADELTEREFKQLHTDADTSGAKVQSVNAYMLSTRSLPITKKTRQAATKTKVDGKQCLRFSWGS